MSGPRRRAGPGRRGPDRDRPEVPADHDELVARLRAVPAPSPVLDRDRLAALTPRQREILDELGALFAGGFAEVTMAELASRLTCSLRTLYDLAPSRDELVSAVVDRNLRAVGRSATAAIRPGSTTVEAIRAYLAGATVAVAGTTEAFARDVERTPAVAELQAAHADYLVEVTRALLDLAVERGEIDPVDTAAVARVIAGVGRDFVRPEVIGRLGSSSPKAAADEVVAIVLRGLARDGATAVGGAVAPDERRSA